MCVDKDAKYWYVKQQNIDEFVHSTAVLNIERPALIIVKAG